MGPKRTQLADSLNELLDLLEKTADIDQFLQDTVALIADHTDAEICAVYLYDEAQGKLVRAALHGDGNADAFPEIIPSGEGMIGLAFAQSRPLRSARAGEDDVLGSQLLVPIRHGSFRIGVFALGHGTDGFFSDEDERFLRAVASHLGGSLENASLLLRLRRSAERGGEGREPVEESFMVTGRTVSGGVAVGSSFLLDRRSTAAVEQLGEDRPLEERQSQFEEAVNRTLRQIEELQSETETQFADIASLIFNSHLLMIRDDSFTGQMRELVANGHLPAEAITTVVEQYATSFEQLEETRFKEKAQDVRDLGHRLMQNLDPSEQTHGDYSGNIIIAQEVFPSELVKLAVQHVEGIVFFGATVTAHVAILAGSLGIPVMMTADRRLLTISPGTDLLVAASDAKLFVRPSAEVIDEYTAKKKPETPAPDRTTERAEAATEKRFGESSCTACDTPVSILANINLLTDLNAAIRNGAEGIGLYRSEFPFIIRNDFIAEDEQYLVYRRIFEAFPEQEVVLRTVDIGGDKLIDASMESERNPFLGVRGIRFSLAHREMFREQLRAMLRAGAGRDLRIMFPMVSTLEEVEQGREEIERARDELERHGTEHNGEPRIGAMIELPSAVEAVSELSEATDFLSIGTNDLVMYLLAVDRTNERLNELYRTYHPTVLRVLRRIADGAGEKRSELSVCGDSAADPVMVPFYLGIGIRKLSVSPGLIRKTRELIGSYRLAQAESVREEMLKIKNNKQMQEYLEAFNQRLALQE